MLNCSTFLSVPTLIGIPAGYDVHRNLLILFFCALCAVINTKEEQGVPFSPTMRSSKFCYVPRGQFGGDLDRFVPAMLHGCIPVMTGGTKKTPVAAPVEEHPDVFWPDFSVEVLIEDLQGLNLHLEHLERIPGRLDRMAACSWPSLAEGFMELHLQSHLPWGGWKHRHLPDGDGHTPDEEVQAPPPPPPPPAHPRPRCRDAPLLLAISR